MPTISVIVPVYKVEPYLHRCVDSILGQTYTDFELILVDDGSPDNCPAICDEYEEKDSRVHVIHQENGGLSAARNAGIDWAFANSDSQWLSFIDSDDWLHPKYLEQLLTIAIDNQADISFCTLTAFTEERGIYKELEFWGKPSCATKSGLDILKESTQLRDGKLSGHHVIACNKLYDKRIFASLRYPIGQVHEDEAVAHRILGKCNKIVGTCDSLYYYRQHSESITQSKDGLYRELCITLAYGDRLIYFHENNIPLSEILFHQYWAVLLRYYFVLSKHTKCLALLKKTRDQMRRLAKPYKSSTNSRTEKACITLFSYIPKAVSGLFIISVKVRSLIARLYN